MIEKVTAVIARLGAAGPEVCVFEHPKAGVQLPAGSVEHAEEPRAAALREAFEETGLDRVAVAGEPVALEPNRLVVPFALHGTTPDEWWVFTPDGGGHVWRCHWRSIDDAMHAIGPQAAWLEAVAPSMLSADLPVARRRPLATEGSDLTIEVFWAPPWPGDRAQISWLERDAGVDERVIRRSEVVAFTDDGAIVAQAEGDPPPYGLPGGRREEGETPEDTARRELWEEACAEMIASELIGYQSFRRVNGDALEPATVDAMFWARARCHPFEARFETKVRALLTAEELRADPMFGQPLSERLIDRALATEARVRAAEHREETRGG